MKKTYITPSAVAIKMQMAVLAPASSLEKSSNGIDNESSVLGREFDFNDED